MKLFEIYKKFEENEEKLKAYFEEEFRKTPPQLYLSCDLRHSGHKVAVVDTNLFPAGFNNLCKVFTGQAIDAFKNYLSQSRPQARKLLIFAEAHTRNKFYFENLSALSDMLTQGGFEVRVGSSSPDFPETPYTVSLNGDKTLQIFQVIQEHGKATLADGWAPDAILSNNDFSTGPDPVLQNISQPVLPSMELGWHRRRKSEHFRLYNEIAAQVGEMIGLDPWLITCFQASESSVDLTDPTSLKRLAQTVDDLLAKIRKKYAEHGIDSSPYVFVKSNSGTYGMGVTYFTSGEEVLTVNRKTRTKLLSSKGGGKVSEYLIQEGIVTADFYSGYPIEPVIYQVGETPIGGFFRLNEEKDEWSSLNTKGMAFSCLCLHKLDQPHEEPFLRCVEKQTLVKLSYHLTKIAGLATAREGKI
ncbi:MAG: glutamate--cysteine ligase [bacterium]